MPIIGKLFKKSSEFSFKRNVKKGRKYTNQLRALYKLLAKAQETNFGNKHNFQTILYSKKLVKEYQKNVPITHYEEFLTNWLHKSMEGEKNHTWPGRINFYALSSGTTGSPSKRIPVTKQMIRSFQKTSVSQISTLYKLDLSDDFYNAKLLVVGGSSNLKKIGKRFEGDLSGILKKHTSFIFNPLTKPNNNITKITDWNKKLEKIIEKAPSWDIGIVAGVPSWCLMLIEKIVERYNLNSIHDIWPNFEVYMHGGVFMQPYTSRLDKVIDKKVFLLDTYLASEGYFAYQTSPEKEGMQLLLENGIFYEFIPFTSDYFTEDGSVKDKFKAYSIAEVIVGVEYAMVISTNAGLWRYLIGDLVKFIDTEKYEIKITGRIQQYLSLAGEHLSLENINSAITVVCSKMSIDIPEFTIYADLSALHHSWFIGSNNDVNNEVLIAEIDEALCAVNDDYKTCRNHNLNSPTITVFSPSLFYEFLDSIGKSGSQNKFPRVMNDEQAILWKDFLVTNEPNILK